MAFEIRELKTPEEMEEVVRLQMVVGGLPERHVTSPITLTALALTEPRVGWVLGAFEGDRMVGFSTTLSTQEPGLVYGFMVAVDPDSQNAGAGRELLLRGFDLYRDAGTVQRVCWAYEPMEAKNAHLYLNKLGGRCRRYMEEYYYLHSGLHAVLPQDRFLVEVSLDAVGPRPLEVDTLEEALERYPVARPDHLPDSDAVLVEVPYRMHELLPRNPDAAMAFRMDTRAVFDHYINQGGYAAVNLITGPGPGSAHDVPESPPPEPRAFYLVKRA